MQKREKRSRLLRRPQHVPAETAFGIDAFTLKLIAITSMAVDHLGALLYPEQLWLRVVGRLALPLFAFLLVEGYHHTRHLGRYLLRLLVFALLAQPVYRLVFPHGLNVFFDLLVGLCVIRAADRIRSPWLVAALLAAAGFGGFYGGLDCWHLAVFMVFVFHVTRGRFGFTIAALSGLLVVNACLFWVVTGWTGNPAYQLINFINLGCILALPFLRFYNGQRGRDWRYFFYAFYPAHLLALHAIGQMWGRAGGGF